MPVPLIKIVDYERDIVKLNRWLVQSHGFSNELEERLQALEFRNSTGSRGSDVLPDAITSNPLNLGSAEQPWNGHFKEITAESYIGLNLLSIKISVEILTGVVTTNTNAIVWPTANKAFYIPFSINSEQTVKRIITFIGDTSSGNIDVGIYSTNGTKEVSAGSTAMGTNNQVQIFDIADTTLPAGKYYMAMAVDNVTAKIRISAGAINTLFGIKEEASAFPLPATATFTENTTSNFIPHMSVSFET